MLLGIRNLLHSEAGMASDCSATVGKKRKRPVLTFEDKLKICELVRHGRSLACVAA